MPSKINCYYTSKNYNKTESNGESKVKEYLDKNKIDYDLQVSFSGLKSESGNYLRYDFLIDHMGLLEIDGPQHFNKNNIFGESAYEETYKRDLIKNQYAENHDIPLFRIVYTNNGFKYLIDELKVYLNMLDNKASTKEIRAKYLRDYTKKAKEQIIKNLHTNYKERNYCKLGMVRYNNKFNYFIFPKLSKHEAGIFMYLLYKMQERVNSFGLSLNNQQATIKTNSQILSKYMLVPHGDSVIKASFNSLINKLHDFNWINILDNDHKYTKVFSKLELKDDYIIATINTKSDIIPMFYKQNSGFTTFSILNYWRIGSPKAKTLYRLLVRYCNTNIKIYKHKSGAIYHKDDFCRLMHISFNSSYYTNGTIKTQIINRTIKQLNDYFKNLKVDVTRNIHHKINYVLFWDGVKKVKDKIMKEQKENIKYFEEYLIEKLLFDPDIPYDEHPQESTNKLFNEIKIARRTNNIPNNDFGDLIETTAILPESYFTDLRKRV